MIAKFLNDSRAIVVTVFALIALLWLENATGLSKWLLLVPVLLGAMAAVSAWTWILNSKR